MPHSDPSTLPFSAPPTTHTFTALLFDMDGTIIDSTAAIEKYWRRLGTSIGVDGDYILQTSHGRRSVDVLAIHAPHLATWEYVREAEGAIPKVYGAEAVEIPGSRALLDGLERAGAKWGVVTSGTRPLVEGWFGVMGLAHPRTLVTAEEVSEGKPDPAGYRLGAERLGVAGGEGEVVVFEDAPAGVRAGKRAGFSVVALATTHRVEQLREAGADWIVRDMRSVTLTGVEGKGGKVEIEIRDALVV